MRKFIIVSLSVLILLGLCACKKEEPTQLEVPIDVLTQNATTPAEPTIPMEQNKNMNTDASSVNKENISQKPTEEPVIDYTIVDKTQYVMDWDNASITNKGVMRIEMRPNDDGSIFEILCNDTEDTASHFAIVYRTAVALYYAEQTPEKDLEWVLVDTSDLDNLASENTYFSFAHKTIRSFVEETFSYVVEINYEGRKDGFDVVRYITDVGEVYMDLYIIPGTTNVTKIFLHTNDYDYVIDFINDHSSVGEVPLPPEKVGTLGREDFVAAHFAFVELVSRVSGNEISLGFSPIE